MSDFSGITTRAMVEARFPSIHAMPRQSSLSSMRMAPTESRLLVKAVKQNYQSRNGSPAAFRSSTPESRTTGSIYYGINPTDKTRGPFSSSTVTLNSMKRTPGFAALFRSDSKTKSERNVPLVHEDNISEDGTRFDILDPDPFRSESPIAMLETPRQNKVKIVPGRIVPTVFEVSAETFQEMAKPVSRVKSVKSVLTRLATNGKAKLGFSTKAEARSLLDPPTISSPVFSTFTPISPLPPKLQLDFKEEPLMDTSSFTIPDLPISKPRTMKVEGASLGHWAPPHPPTGPVAYATALQLELEGNHAVTIPQAVPNPSRLVPVEQLNFESPLHSAHVTRTRSWWIAQFNEEAKKLINGAISLTDEQERLVVEILTDAGSRKPVIDTQAATGYEVEVSPQIQSTKALPFIPSSDSVALLEAIGDSEDAEATSPTHANLEGDSLFGSQSEATSNEIQASPLLADDQYLPSDDEITVADIPILASSSLNSFNCFPVKEREIEDAIRRIQRREEALQSLESDTDSDSDEPQSQSVTRNVSVIPQSTIKLIFSPNTTKPRKRSVLRKPRSSKNLLTIKEPPRRKPPTRPIPAVPQEI